MRKQDFPGGGGIPESMTARVRAKHRCGLLAAALLLLFSLVPAQSALAFDDTVADELVARQAEASALLTFSSETFPAEGLCALPRNVQVRSLARYLQAQHFLLMAELHTRLLAAHPRLPNAAARAQLRLIEAEIGQGRERMAMLAELLRPYALPSQGEIAFAPRWVVPASALYNARWLASSTQSMQSLQSNPPTDLAAAALAEGAVAMGTKERVERTIVEDFVVVWGELDEVADGVVMGSHLSYYPGAKLELFDTELLRDVLIYQPQLNPDFSPRLMSSGHQGRGGAISGLAAYGNVPIDLGPQLYCCSWSACDHLPVDLESLEEALASLLSNPELFSDPNPAELVATEFYLVASWLGRNSLVLAPRLSSFSLFGRELPEPPMQAARAMAGTGCVNVCTECNIDYHAEDDHFFTVDSRPIDILPSDDDACLSTNRSLIANPSCLSDACAPSALWYDLAYVDRGARTADAALRFVSEACMQSGLSGSALSEDCWSSSPWTHVCGGPSQPCTGSPFQEGPPLCVSINDAAPLCFSCNGLGVCH
ncbi:MAG: hypothetical protein RBU37_09420, partial [Myxococcota bacterium]|nr:hypothetical protein [Myxococcota bacterium]